jgi:hypothetical protein
MELKKVLENRSGIYERQHPKDFDLDFAEHIIGAAVDFYSNQSCHGFGLFRFHVYSIPAKCHADACAILVRVYDIWDPIRFPGGRT